MSKPTVRSLASLLFVALFSAPVLAAPQCPGDDTSEPNDTCNMATSWNLGGANPTFVGLGSNPDFFEVFVPAGQVILVDLYAIPSRTTCCASATCCAARYSAFACTPSAR